MSTSPAGATVAWFNCAAGVAGDMVLAALVDAGADAGIVADAIADLGVEGAALTFEQVQRGGIRARWLNLVVDTHDPDEAGHHHHRLAREVLDTIGSSALAPRVRDRAVDVYRTLAEVEGEVHGIDPADVELHEVGAVDSIIDVVGACAALDALGIEHVVCSPIAVGYGTVRTGHGDFPNPVPAVSSLLARRGAPVVGIDTTMELATPTGVALMTVLAASFGAMPAMSVRRTGFGAGTADPAGRPNVVQVVVGAQAEAGSASGPGRPARLVEANVDDVTGEVLAHTIVELLAAGAHDAWVSPMVMKKGRPAHTVHALCDDATFDAVAAVLLAETGTLGLRATDVSRWPQQRAESTVDVGGVAVRVKRTGDRVKVEHDDAAAAARVLGIPLREVLRLAEAAARG